MKKMMLFLSVVFGVMLSAAEINWMTDFDDAAKKAKTDKKPIIILFVGSDWCPPCKMMLKETWQNKDVIEYVNKHYIPLLVDLPRRKQLPEEQVKKNNAMAEKYHLISVPTILVVDAAGKVTAKTGFNRPDPFMKFLKKNK